MTKALVEKTEKQMTMSRGLGRLLSGQCAGQVNVRTQSDPQNPGKDQVDIVASLQFQYQKAETGSLQSKLAEKTCHSRVLCFNKKLCLNIQWKNNEG